MKKIFEELTQEAWKNNDYIGTKEQKADPTDIFIHCRKTLQNSKPSSNCFNNRHNRLKENKPTGTVKLSTIVFEDEFGGLSHERHTREAEISSPPRK